MYYGPWVFVDYSYDLWPWNWVKYNVLELSCAKACY